MNSLWNVVDSQTFIEAKNLNRNEGRVGNGRIYF